MSRDYKLYLDDILDSIETIETFTKNMSLKEFSKNRLVRDAVIRNLEVIGEASKKIPIEIKRKYTKVEWKKISGLRDVIAHEYFGINLEIIWDIIRNKLSQLKAAIKGIK